MASHCTSSLITAIHDSSQEIHQVAFWYKNRGLFYWISCCVFSCSYIKKKHSTKDGTNSFLSLHSDKICSGINISNTFQMQDLLLKLKVLGKGSLEASSNNQHSIWKTVSFAIPVPGWHWCQAILLAHAVVIKWKHFPHYWPFVWWIPLTKASDTKLWCFLWSVPKEMVE